MRQTLDDLQGASYIDSRDLQLIADVLNSLRPDLPTDDMTDHGLDQVCKSVAIALASTHGRFDRHKFLDACGCFK